MGTVPRVMGMSPPARGWSVWVAARSCRYLAKFFARHQAARPAPARNCRAHRRCVFAWSAVDGQLECLELSDGRHLDADAL